MKHWADDYEQGIMDENQRMIELLKKLGTLRDSITGQGLVLYTQDGAIDIISDDLRRKDS